jgi:hypothetical protein
VLSASSLVTSLLARQKKVTRLPGRDPARSLQAKKEQKHQLLSSNNLTINKQNPHPIGF